MTPILVRWGTTWYPGQKLEQCPGKPGWVWASSAAFRGRKLLVAGEWKEIAPVGAGTEET